MAVAVLVPIMNRVHQPFVRPLISDRTLGDATAREKESPQSSQGNLLVIIPEWRPSYEGAAFPMVLKFDRKHFCGPTNGTQSGDRFARNSIDRV
jgi:hypothetical protein